MTTTTETATEIQRATCKRADLVEGLSVMARLIGTRVLKPVLACAKIEIADDKMKISATNLEQAATYTSSQVQMQSGPMVFAVGCAKLLSVASNISSDTLKISVEGEYFVVLSENGRFKFPTMPYEEMPPIPTETPVKDFTEVAVEAVAKLYAQTRGSTADSNTTYTKNGIFVETGKGEITFLSTDGKRIAHAKSPAKCSKISSIVPSKAFDLLLSTKTDADETLLIQQSENSIVFSRDDLVVVTNTIEGTFPNCKDVLSSIECHTKCEIGRDEFLSILKQSSPFTDNGTGGNPLSLTFNNRGLSLRASNKDGESELKCPCKVNGKDITLGLNEKFLSNALSCTDWDTVEILMDAPNRPVILKFGPNYQHVIQVINLQ